MADLSALADGTLPAERREEVEGRVAASPGLQELLERQLASEQAEALAEKLSTGTWTHDYPILPREAQEFGLKVSTEMPQEVLQLMSLYPQPVRQQQGGVEYLPTPRQRPATTNS